MLGNTVQGCWGQGVDGWERRGIGMSRPANRTVHMEHFTWLQMHTDVDGLLICFYHLQLVFVLFQDVAVNHSDYQSWLLSLQLASMHC